MVYRHLGIIGVAVAAAALATAVTADAPSVDGSGALKRPADVRELVFLSSGHGMAYGPVGEKARQAGGSPPFTNVFVTRDAYHSFMQSGKWPDGVTFFLEVRRAVDNSSIGTAGNSQGEVLGLEAEHKDSTRYPDGGFAFFDFGPGGKDLQGRMIPRTASCYACHRQHGAVEWTFTQFYPEQFAIAQKMGTVRKDYDPNIGDK